MEGDNGKYSYVERRVRCYSTGRMWLQPDGDGSPEEVARVISSSSLFPTPEECAQLANPRPLREQLKRGVDRVLERGMADVAATLLECERLLAVLQRSRNIAMVSGIVYKLSPPNIGKLGQWIMYSCILFFHVDPTKKRLLKVCYSPECREVAETIHEGDKILCIGSIATQKRDYMAQHPDCPKTDLFCHHIEILRTERSECSTNAKDKPCTRGP